MMHRKIGSLRFLWLVLTSVFLSPVWAQDVGETVIMTGNIKEDVYVAGARINILATVTGDVLAAGGRVSINQRVSGDVIAAGGVVEVRGQVQDDVRVAGGRVTLSGPIGGDAVAAGGSVTLAPNASVGGRAWFSGGEVEIGGRVRKQLKVSAGAIVISGTVRGDAHLYGRDIEILSTARIEGDVNYTSPQKIRIAPGAVISGEVTHKPLILPQGPTRTQKTGFGLVCLVSFMLAGIVLYLSLPNFSLAAARNVAADPWHSLGLGLAVLFVTPPVVVLLFVTVIGIPLGLALFALYLVFLFAGYLTGILYLGELGGRLLMKGRELTTGWRVLTIVAAVLVLGVARLIPIAGGIIVFLLLVFGTGALQLQTYRVYAMGPSTRLAGTSRRTPKRRR